MARLSFKEEEINDVFQLTVAVLQLGNLTVGALLAQEIVLSPLRWCSD
jgi:hypothetical protein